MGERSPRLRPKPKPDFFNTIGASPTRSAEPVGAQASVTSKAELRQARQRRAEMRHEVRARERFKAPAATKGAKVQNPEFRLDYLFSPIPNRMAAKAAIRVGVIAALVYGALMAAIGLWGYPDEAGIVVMQLGIGLLFGACAFGIWCGFSLAAAAALALCGFDLVMNINALGGVGALFHLSGGILHVALRWVVLPLALWAGFRGCQAWQRLLDEAPTEREAVEP